MGVSNRESASAGQGSAQANDVGSEQAKDWESSQAKDWESTEARDCNSASAGHAAGTGQRHGVTMRRIGSRDESPRESASAELERHHTCQGQHG
jgi:hypothetical protein